MTCNNTSEVKSVNSGVKIKSEHQEDDNDCTTTIPSSWKKFGEVFYNELDQPVFVCSICLEDAGSIGRSTLFTTYDVSEFLFHLQHHFITLYSKNIDGISIKKSRNEANNSNSIKSMDIHPVKIEKNPIGIVGDNTEKLVDNAISAQTKELYQLDIKEEIQDNYWEHPLFENFYSEDSEDDKSYTKEDEMSRFTFSNSNYYYDDHHLNISGAEGDDEANDNFEGCESKGFEIDKNRKDEDFLKHSDSVEFSDEEERIQDIKDSAKIKNINTSTNNAKEDKDDADTYFYKCTLCSLAFGQRIDLLKHMRSHKSEETSSNNKKSHPINGIPTPEASPCESSPNQRNKNNFHRYQYNDYNGQSQFPFSSNQVSKTRRPFRSFQCKICGKRTATEHTMQIHQRRFHSSILERESITNQYTFEYFHQVPQPDQYIRQLTDRGVKGQLLTRPFQCKICNKRTGTQQAMKLHQQRFHSPSSHLITTQCEICHKRIFTPKLQQHMIVHRAAQYKCDYCGLIYKHKQSLTIHIKKFHPNSKLDS